MSSKAYKPTDLLGTLNPVETKYAPETLYVAGDPGLLERGIRVSVVGSRKAPAEKLGATRDLAAWLVSHGVIVVSGLALGVDTAAHRGAIEAGGRTVAVLGTSLEDAYPRENRALQEEIARDHAAVSQFAPGVPTRKGNFPRRNRTMALISEATIIVDAGESSGTQHQGWEALRLGRTLLLVDPIASSTSWGQKMLSYGAHPLRVGEGDLIQEILPEAITSVGDSPF